MKEIKSRNWIALMLSILAYFVSLNSVAGDIQTPLLADQAFVFSLSQEGPHTLLANWHIAPGYYLYRERLHIAVSPDSKNPIQLPMGELKYDSDRGSYEIYSGKLNIPVLLQTNLKSAVVNVDYQGCSEAGFCYPPIHKTMRYEIQAMSASSPVQSLLTDQYGIVTMLQTQHFATLLLIFMGLGLLLAFTPCVWPMIPILTSIIVGQKQSVSTKKAFLLSLSYVLGSAITYAIAGMVAAVMGSSLQVWLQTPWVIGLTSGLFVLLALSLFGFYNLQLPSRWQNQIIFWSNRQQGGSYFGVFCMGTISSLIVSPCVTAPLVGVLMYIAQTGNLMLGASALFMLGLGMGMPLLLIGVSAGRWLPKSGPWMEVVKKIFGVLMLGLALWLASRMLSTLMIWIILGLLLLGIVVWMSIYLLRLMKRQVFTRGLGFTLGLSGMLVMAGGIGMPKMMDEWKNLHQKTVPARSFIVVHNVADFKQQLLLAQVAHQPVLLDFYADWCESCVDMDKNVFSQLAIQKALSHYVLLRADLSANSLADEEMMKHFSVIAPPTVLFFDAHGQEMNEQRIAGEVGATEFLKRIK